MNIVILYGTVEYMELYIGSTVCTILRAVVMCYKQCGLADHNVVKVRFFSPED